MGSSIIAVVSDTHVGSSTAIAPPKFSIHVARPNETQQTEYNIAQHWLYAAWVDFFDYARTLAGIRGKTRKKRLIILHLGDIVDGEHHNSVELMNEEEDQIEAACNLLRPIVAQADAARFCYGTPTHNGGTGELERRVAGELGAPIDYAWSLDIDKVLLDLMHHGSAGKVDWSSSAARFGAAIANDYLRDGKPAPDYILRGHAHVVDDSGSHIPGTRAIALPSWQLRTAYGYKVSSYRKRSDIGGLIIDTAEPDRPIVSRLRYTAPGGFVNVETI